MPYIQYIYLNLSISIYLVHTHTQVPLPISVVSDATASASIMYCMLFLVLLQDLHRTGCSLFCGEEAEDNQAMLKRVLLAFARWNKGVGYCQGFNMLAAIILEVMERQESDALKVSHSVSCRQREGWELPGNSLFRNYPTH